MRRRLSFFDWRWGDSSRFFGEADWLLGETDWLPPQFEPSSATGSGNGTSADRVNPNPAPTGIIDSFLDGDELLLPPQFQQGAGTGSGTGAMTPSLAPETITYAGSGLVFVNTYGSGVSTTFRNEIVAAENYFQSHFTNSCTIRCSFDLQSLSAGVSGENSFYAVAASYSTFVNALASHATSADDLATVAALQRLSDPTGGHGVELSLGEARVLGLAGPGTSIDDYVVLNSLYWTSSALQSAPNDATDVILHEISEGGMGRIGSLGIDGSYWEPMDFLRFTASGQRDFTGGRDGVSTYFSIDGSSVNTGLRYHNSVNVSGQFDGYDFADWDGVGSDSNYNDPFGPGGPGAGGSGVLSATDLRIMDVLGWTPTVTAPPQSDLTPTNISLGSTSVVAGAPLSVNWTLLNQGSGAANSTSTTELRITQSATSSAGTDLVGVSTPALAAGASVAQSGTLTAPTAPGTYYVWVVADDLRNVTNQSNTSNDAQHSVAFTVTAPAASPNHVTHDFNGAGYSDVLWRNASNGAWAWSDIQAGNVWHDLGGSSTAYNVVGVGDFNGDGYSDVLWRNNSNGAWGWSDIHNNLAWHDLGGSLSAYGVVGVGDFNGDGSSDVLWRNNSNGAWGWSDIHNNNAWHDLGGSSTAYSIAGVGDFNGDGYSDVLWRNNSTGAWGYSDVHGNAWHDLGSSLTAYSIVGVGDFNHDGSSDVLWRNNSTGAWGWSDIHNNNA
jgi:hypothetical protein